jgi:hypothetical protein
MRRRPLRRTTRAARAHNKNEQNVRAGGPLSCNWDEEVEAPRLLEDQKTLFCISKPTLRAPQPPKR